MSDDQSLIDHFHKNNLELPIVIHHLVCGKDILLYFGPMSDAQKLKTLECITTLDGCHILPRDISACPHCGQLIKIDNIVARGREEIKIEKLKRMQEQTYRWFNDITIFPAKYWDPT